MPRSWAKVREPFYLSSGLWLVMSDVHVPFHEPKPIEAAIAYAKQNKVDGIFFNGDLQDCAAISYWTTDRKRDFDKELETFIDFLDFIRYEFPKEKIVYKPGNHEYRLPRYYASKVPELLGVPLALMTETLGLEERGIEYLDYSQLVYAGKLPILHGHEIRGGSTAVSPARWLQLKTKMWSMCGHFHQTSEQPGKTLENKLITCWSLGCFCDLEPDYNPFGNNWCWGGALINVEKDKSFEVRNFRILPSGKVV